MKSSFVELEHLEGDLSGTPNDLFLYEFVINRKICEINLKKIKQIGTSVNWLAIKDGHEQKNRLVKLHSETKTKRYRSKHTILCSILCSSFIS